MIVLCEKCFNPYEKEYGCRCDGLGNSQLEERLANKEFERFKKNIKPIQQKENWTFEYPVRRGTELELYPNGALKRYKY